MNDTKRNNERIENMKKQLNLIKNNFIVFRINSYERRILYDLLEEKK